MARRSKATVWPGYCAPRVSTERAAWLARGRQATSVFQPFSCVVREVDAAPDLNAALEVLVAGTRLLMAADVCTVYFTQDDDRRHVIAATDGLSSST